MNWTNFLPSGKIKKVQSVKFLYSYSRQIDYFIESGQYGFLFMSRKTLETNEWVSKVLQWVNKIHTKHLLWCCLFFIYIYGQFHVLNLPNRILSSLYFTRWNIYISHGEIYIFHSISWWNIYISHGEIYIFHTVESIVAVH